MSILIQDFITPRKNTRPQLKLLGVRGIVVHYTATPKATAKNERDYFNNGAGGRSASAHVFVDKKEARQIIPFNEVAYHANDHACRIPALQATASYYEHGGANLTSIGVEMCIEADGSLHPDTLKRTIEVVATLCKTYKLDETDVYRHYDVTGKNCPAMFVSDPSQFTAFKKAVKAKLSGASTVTVPKPTAPSKPVSTAKYTLPTGILKKGSRGTAVLQLQKALVAVHFYPDKNAKNYGVDGIFGVDTLDALTRFQKVYVAYEVDGIYGSNTRKALDKLLNK